jgi:hypothetical protein
MAQAEPVHVARVQKVAIGSRARGMAQNWAPNFSFKHGPAAITKFLNRPVGNTRECEAPTIRRQMCVGQKRTEVTWRGSPSLGNRRAKFGRLGTGGDSFLSLSIQWQEGMPRIRIRGRLRNAARFLSRTFPILSSKEIPGYTSLHIGVLGSRFPPRQPEANVGLCRSSSVRLRRAPPLALRFRAILHG